MPRPSSRQILGSWVVLPDPVSPATTTTWWSRIAVARSLRRWLTGSWSGNRTAGTEERRRWTRSSAWSTAVPISARTLSRLARALIRRVPSSRRPIRRSSRNPTSGRRSRSSESDGDAVDTGSDMGVLQHRSARASPPQVGEWSGQSHPNEGSVRGETGLVSRSETASLRDLWPHVRSHRVVLVVVAVVSLVVTGLALVQPLMLQRVVDTVGTGGAEGALSAAVLLLVVVTLAEAVGSAFQSYLLQRTAEGVVLGARRSLVGHLLRLPIVEYDRRRLGDLISRVGTDTTLLRAVVTSGLFEVVSSVLMFAGAVVLMALVDVVLLLITLLAVLVGAVGVIALGRAIRRTSERAQARVGDMTAAVERALSAIRTLRASRP